MKELQFSISFFRLPIFSFYYYNSLGWFRIFGKGLKFKDHTKHSLLFSERNKLVKSIKIQNWYISYLP